MQNYRAVTGGKLLAGLNKWGTLAKPREFMPLDRRPVASLWIGEELQYLNQLCLKSHLLHGHPVTLYCTDKLKNAPEGVEVRPANGI